MNHEKWNFVQDERVRMSQVHMRDLFDADPLRANTMTAQACGLTLDYSKNILDERSLSALLELAEANGVFAKRDAMFAGKRINKTEDRAVLHTALRLPATESAFIDGVNVVPEVHATLNKMKQFVNDVQTGKRKGFTGKPFKDVVAIGIGGSFLGPKIVTEALKPYRVEHIKVHFVANVDGQHITDVLSGLNPETTLVVMSSKSFTTQETLKNTETARDWFLANGGSFDDVSKHFVCVSSNVEKAISFGIDENNIFPMWDWVGGRYSLWSAIGLPIALALEFEAFEDLLAGAHAMDQHFINSPAAENLPVLMGVIGVWYTSFFGIQNHALLPYSHNLRGLPAYVQQLDMESNGKSVDINGEAITYCTGPIIWGGEGTNGQHAFHQHMHQGTKVLSCDFILPIKPAHKEIEHHQMLAANCFAQSKALMQGISKDEAENDLVSKGVPRDVAHELAKHKEMHGNQPSNTLLMDELSPETLGALIALYEHKVFVQGAIWNVNSFDQWGVELGKALGDDILSSIKSGNCDGMDSSTSNLVSRFIS